MDFVDSPHFLAPRLLEHSNLPFVGCQIALKTIRILPIPSNEGEPE